MSSTGACHTGRISWGYGDFTHELAKKTKELLQQLQGHEHDADKVTDRAKEGNKESQDDNVKTLIATGDTCTPLNDPASSVKVQLVEQRAGIGMIVEPSRTSVVVSFKTISPCKCHYWYKEGSFSA